MSILQSIAARTAAALRKTAKPNAPAAPMAAVPDQSLTGKLLTAIGHPPEKKYRVLVNLGGGEHEVRLMTSAEALAYLNRDGAWHRIG